ncbi:MAG: complex I NDUFA9 subunit family protein [Rhodoferax sp.]|nr:complex I NDUFA9 subunit family protein [Rhodoferax sp.]
MNTVLVLGGTGFVGSHVCEKLVRQGWHVVLPTRRRAHAQHLLHLPTLTVLECDVHDEKALRAAAAGCDASVNLVAILHGDAQAFERVHVALPQKWVRACRSSGIGSLVQVSALGADPLQAQQRPSNYLRSRSQGEAVLLQAAAAGVGQPFSLSVLRPSVIFGAEDRLLNLFARMQRTVPLVPLACADAVFQPVWVEDVAEAVVRCLRTPAPVGTPRILELAGPQVYTLRDLVQLAGQLAGVAEGAGRPVLGLPPVLGRLQAWVMEHVPGGPLMSRDNLDSMQVPNVAHGGQPGLQSLGITPTALLPVAADYLNRLDPGRGLLGLRARATGR